MARVKNNAARIQRANRELDEFSPKLIKKHKQEFIDLIIRAAVPTGGEPLFGYGPNSHYLPS